MKNYLRLLFTSLFMVLASCSPSSSQLKKTLEDNPDIITNVIEKHPDLIMESLMKAQKGAREKQAQREDEMRAKEREEEFKNPKKPVIDEERAVLGSKNAPILIVEYSDFECPYCKRGYDTVNEVKKKYGDKVRFMYKHLPLEFHPRALPAAKYFEAVALQSTDLAYKFHNMVFENQDKLKSEGEKFLESAVKKVGADLGKVKKALDGEKVAARLKADKEEATKFDISGTPGFIVNGVAIRGAYPASEFEAIIEKQLKK